jgi:uncharacterized protein (TIGR02001 family)
MPKYKLITLVAVTSAATPSLTLAEDAPKPPYTLSANVFLVSDYFFRGITQTWGKPAIQGGFDFSHQTGIYLGTWASNVSGNQYAGGSMEWDLYGGYLYKLNDDVSLGGGVLYYYYPGASTSKAFPGFWAGAVPDVKFNTFEGNLQANWKWVNVKFSYAFTNYFGANKDTGFKDDTKGTYYPEVNVNYPLMDNLTLVGHVGYTQYKEKLAAPNAQGKDDPSYADWKLGVSYVWKDGWTVGAYYVDTSNKDFYKSTGSFANSETKDLARAAAYITVGRTF